MKDNEYITDMHRPQIKNLLSCLRSVFSIHAETGNIWTHLIGALVFFALIIHTLSRSSDDFVNPFWEKFVFTTFLTCAFLCLSFSTAFHTLGCNTEETCIFCGRLDYTGIAILITGSFLPWVYYSFYCQPTIQFWYIGTIVALGVLCTFISLMKAFALPKYRHLRGILFLVFGLCGIAPCIHSTFFHGIEYSFSKGQMQNLILMGALYCVGVVFFITRFPESYWPGKFNLIFQSHQIFHVLVVSAALVQVYAITVLQDNRLIEGDTCPVETPLAASIHTTQS
jgi:adiponectin receptor